MKRYCATCLLLHDRMVILDNFWEVLKHMWMIRLKPGGRFGE